MHFYYNHTIDVLSIDEIVIKREILKGEAMILLSKLWGPHQIKGPGEFSLLTPPLSGPAYKKL